MTLKTVQFTEYRRSQSIRAYRSHRYYNNVRLSIGKLLTRIVLHEKHTHTRTKQRVRFEKSVLFYTCCHDVNC